MKKLNLKARVDESLKRIEYEFWSRQASLGIGTRVINFDGADVARAGFVYNIVKTKKDLIYYIRPDNQEENFVVANSYIDDLKVQASTKSPGYVPELYKRVLDRYTELFHNHH